jgi:hypothetical protein
MIGFAPARRDAARGAGAKREALRPSVVAEHREQECGNYEASKHMAAVDGGGELEAGEIGREGGRSANAGNEGENREGRFHGSASLFAVVVPRILRGSKRLIISIKR